MRGQPDSKILEAGLILAVAISIAAIGPAFWTHTSDLMREHFDCRVCNRSVHF
jgi:hypothetical protein